MGAPHKKRTQVTLYLGKLYPRFGSRVAGRTTKRKIWWHGQRNTWQTHLAAQEPVPYHHHCLPIRQRTNSDCDMEAPLPSPELKERKATAGVSPRRFPFIHLFWHVHAVCACVCARERGGEGYARVPTCRSSWVYLIWGGLAVSPDPLLGTVNQRWTDGVGRQEQGHKGLWWGGDESGHGPPRLACIQHKPYFSGSHDELVLHL